MGQWDNGTKRNLFTFFTEYERFEYIFSQVMKGRFLADCGFCRIFVIEKVHRQNRPSVRCIVLLPPFIPSSSELYSVLFQTLIHPLHNSNSSSSKL